MDSKEKKSEMIMFMHVMLSHAGAEKVTKYVADNYDMSSIKESIKDIISKCEACQETKVVTTRTKEDTIKLAVAEPRESIYIDICGPLPTKVLVFCEILQNSIRCLLIF